ncbi:MAG: hypothetical protein V4564_10210 [Pseudomonadota bacterium]|nr:hypothetical protein [Sphingomonas sp. ERG5]
MAKAPKIPDESEACACQGAFAWADEKREKATAILGVTDVVFGECDR